MQKLILPIKHCKLTASKSTNTAESVYASGHHSVDLINDTGNRRVYASGAGMVVAVGRGPCGENAAAIWYPNALHWPTGRVQHVVFCYYHLKELFLRKKQIVSKDTAIGRYGIPHMPLTLEAFSGWEDLHFEGLESSLLGGLPACTLSGTRVSPLEWLHCKTSGPDLQTYHTAEDASVSLKDRTIREYD